MGWVGGMIMPTESRQNLSRMLFQDGSHSRGIFQCTVIYPSAVRGRDRRSKPLSDRPCRTSIEAIVNKDDHTLSLRMGLIELPRQPGPMESKRGGQDYTTASL